MHGGGGAAAESDGGGAASAAEDDALIRLLNPDRCSHEGVHWCNPCVSEPLTDSFLEAIKREDEALLGRARHCPRTLEAALESVRSARREQSSSVDVSFEEVLSALNADFDTAEAEPLGVDLAPAEHEPAAVLDGSGSAGFHFQREMAEARAPLPESCEPANTNQEAATLSQEQEPHEADLVTGDLEITSRLRSAMRKGTKVAAVAAAAKQAKKEKTQKKKKKKAAKSKARRNSALASKVRLGLKGKKTSKRKKAHVEDAIQAELVEEPVWAAGKVVGVCKQVRVVGTDDGAASSSSGTAGEAKSKTKTKTKAKAKVKIKRKPAAVGSSAARESGELAAIQTEPEAQNNPSGSGDETVAAQLLGMVGTSGPLWMPPEIQFDAFKGTGAAVRAEGEAEPLAAPEDETPSEAEAVERAERAGRARYSDNCDNDDGDVEHHRHQQSDDDAEDETGQDQAGSYRGKVQPAIAAAAASIAAAAAVTAAASACALCSKGERMAQQLEGGLELALAATVLGRVPRVQARERERQRQRQRQQERERERQRERQREQERELARVVDADTTDGSSSSVGGSARGKGHTGQDGAATTKAVVITRAGSSGSGSSTGLGSGLASGSETGSRASVAAKPPPVPATAAAAEALRATQARKLAQRQGQKTADAKREAQILRRRLASQETCMQRLQHKLDAAAERSSKLQTLAKEL
eukprot:g1211.t1